MSGDYKWMILLMWLACSCGMMWAYPMLKQDVAISKAVAGMVNVTRSSFDENERGKRDVNLLNGDDLLGLRKIPNSMEPHQHRGKRSPCGSGGANTPVDGENANEVAERRRRQKNRARKQKSNGTPKNSNGKDTKTRKKFVPDNIPALRHRRQADTAENDAAPKFFEKFFDTAKNIGQQIQGAVKKMVENVKSVLDSKGSGNGLKDNDNVE